MYARTSEFFPFFCGFITPTFLTGYKIDIGGNSEAARRHLGGISEATL